MPSIDDILRYMFGVWRMMMGKPDGIRFLDISADGFWNSFFAIAVALPALIVGWVGLVNELSADPSAFSGRVSILIRLAMVDMGTWVLPIVILALVAPRAGIGDRFVHYVVASNWASALIIWLMLPAALLRLIAPSLPGLIETLSLTLFVVSMALTWRLTNAVLGKGPSVASAVFAGMFFASLVVLFALQAILGLNVPDQIPG